MSGADSPAGVASLAKDLPPPRSLAAAMAPSPMLDPSTARRVRLGGWRGSISIFLVIFLPPPHSLLAQRVSVGRVHHPRGDGRRGSELPQRDAMKRRSGT